MTNRARYSVLSVVVGISNKVNQQLDGPRLRAQAWNTIREPVEQQTHALTIVPLQRRSEQWRTT